ncbi:hypothetical protein [Tessaracoccus sp. Z1128]
MTVTEDQQLTDPAPPRSEPHARAWRGLGGGFVVKLLLMGVVNAFGISVILSAWQVESWVILGASVVLLLFADWVYFSKRALPLKYLLPGLVFLLIFQVFTLAYTGYVAFTNYGTGHAGSMQQAVDAALIQAEKRLPDSPTYPLAVVRQGEQVGFAITDGDEVKVGTETEPLSVVDGAETADGGTPALVPGWDVVPRAQLLTDTALQGVVTSLRVPVSDDATEGSIRTREGSKGTIYSSSMRWDADAGTLTNTDTGVVYSPDDRGRFVGDDGSSLPAGWYVNVGFDNFVRAVTDPTLAAPLFQVMIWTFVFAIASVVVSFAVGLAFALLYNDERLRARKLIRTLLILPYAFPALHVCAAVARHAQRRVRRRQRVVLLRLFHRVAVGSAAGTAGRDLRQRVAQLPLLVPRLHRGPAGAARRHFGSRDHRRR